MFMFVYVPSLCVYICIDMYIYISFMHSPLKASKAKPFIEKDYLPV